MTDRDAVTVAKALSHRERIAILRDLRDHHEPVSPASYSRRVRDGAAVSNDISYHFAALRKLRVITVVYRRSIRGSQETFHRIGNGPRGRLALLMLVVIDAASEPD